jgi:ubiquitin-protein ligase E3 A
VALAIFNQVILPIRFPLLLYKKLVNRPVGHRDLEDIDPELMQSFASIREMKAKGEDVSAVGLKFTATQEIYGEVRTVPLVEGGGTMDVTNENCEDYISRYIEWFTTTSITTAFKAFSEGFYRLFDERMLKIFSADVFDVLVSGETEMDWGALQDATLYRDPRDRKSPAVELFWEVFREASLDQKMKWLQFTTGSDRVPYGGLARLGITIELHMGTDCLPHAHTCYSTFVLPIYKTKEEMRQKVLFAINETEGFGMK